MNFIFRDVNMETLKFVIVILFFSSVNSHVAMDHKSGRSHMFPDEDEKVTSEHSTEETNNVTHHYHATTEKYKGSCEEGSECVHFVSCPAHVTVDKKKFCQTETGKKGICCCTGQNHTGKKQSKETVSLPRMTNSYGLLVSFRIDFG